MKPIFERSDDTKVAAAAAQTPEEIGVLVWADGQKFTLGGDEVGGEQVVAAEAVLAHQPAEHATQSEAGNAGRRDDPAGAGQAKGLRLAVVLAPGEASLGPRNALKRIDPDTLHRREVDHQAAVAHRIAGDVVTAALDRDEQPRLRAKRTAAMTSAGPAQ